MPAWPQTLATIAVVLCPTMAVADDFAGQASVIDGDTLEIHGQRIRFWGIDAPESSQLCRGDDSLPYRCGANAANRLDAFIARRPVNCLPISLDRYPYKRSHLVALRATKISASDPPSYWWPGER